MKQIFNTRSLVIALAFISLGANAQSIYSANQTDLIFSLGDMNTTTQTTSPVVRFSGFLNYESQMHIDFGKTVGMYTGLGIKNVGIINHIDSNQVKFKQRAYALGIPLAIKIGNMKQDGYVALGGELNLMMHYKQKFLYDNTRVKSGEWFSNKVNLLNPAVFFQIKYLKSQVITFKYFLNDFLRYQSGGLTLPDGTVIKDYGRTSKLFYVSWGISIASRTTKLKKENKALELKSAKLEH